jgi:CubicO group peptidase (beta-lactamase class C family)
MPRQCVAIVHHVKCHAATFKKRKVVTSCKINQMKKLILLYIFFLHVHSTNAQSLDTSIIHSMEAAIENGTYPNIHSILISHNNKIIYEKYWSGRDKKEGVDLGVIAHGTDSLHKIASMSKSVTSACVGIALAQGKIKSINEKIFHFFPEYAAQDTGLKAQITIKDLLTMTAGFQWNEGDYNDPANDEWQMNLASNPIAYVLNKPMAIAPGQTFNYNGGETELLGAIVQKSTGKRIDVFAKEYLFTPLGIPDFKWTTTVNSNVTDAPAGLYIKSEDLIKFGLLYMNDGKWNSKQVLSASWVKQSVTPYIVADDGSDPRFNRSEYGFQWWIFDDSIMNKPLHLSACVGNGGQRIFIDKANKLVVVFTGGNYNMPDTYLNPYIMLKKFIYPAVFNKQ